MGIEDHQIRAKHHTSCLLSIVVHLARETELGTWGGGGGGGGGGRGGEVVQPLQGIHDLVVEINMCATSTVTC